MEIAVCPSASKFLRAIISTATGVRPDAFTIGGAVFYLAAQKDPVQAVMLRNHEQKHVEQQAALAPWWARWMPLSWRAWAGLPKFAPLYVTEHLAHGYDGNKYEIEARAAESRG